jgi:glutaredoxin-related protein
MKLFKKILLPTVTSVMLVFGAIPALAEDHATASAEVKTDAVLSVDLSQIDALYTKVLDLRKQDAEVYLQIKTAHQENENALKILREGKKNTVDNGIAKEITEKNKALRDANKEALTQYVELQKKLYNSKEKKQIAELSLKFNALKEQLKPLFEQLKANEDLIKVKKPEVKFSADAIKTLNAQVKSAYDKIKTLQTKEKEFNQQREAGWKAFSQAVNEGNVTGAGAALTKVVEAKTQILNIKTQILIQVQAAGTAITAFSQLPDGKHPIQPNQPDGKHPIQPAVAN